MTPAVKIPISGALGVNESGTNEYVCLLNYTAVPIVRYSFYCTRHWASNQGTTGGNNQTKQWHLPWILVDDLGKPASSTVNENYSTVQPVQTKNLQKMLISGLIW